MADVLTMARKKRHEEHVDHERWAIPYGDLITLLLAFFVVMYAVSSINEGKYRVASDSIEAAFKVQSKSPEIVQAGEQVQVLEGAPTPIQPMSTPFDFKEHFITPPEEAPSETPYEGAQITKQDLEAIEAAAREMSSLADALESEMAPLIDSDLVKIKRNKLWIEVDIQSSILFDSGSAQLARDAIPILEQVAWTLRGQQNRIHVEGFTDDVPINTPIYPSNWELSAARAASVVHLFSRSGLDPTRMAAIGYAEYRPIADNETESGRQQNRRVAIIIFSGEGPTSGPGSPEMLREDVGANAEAAPSPVPGDIGPVPSASLQAGIVQEGQVSLPPISGTVP